MIPIIIAGEMLDNIWLLCTDVVKCYPEMSRAATMVALARSGVGGSMWRAHERVDRQLVSRVEINGVRSRQYPVRTGFLEGMPASGMKAVVNLQAAPRELERKGQGVTLYGVWIGCNSFVDDNGGIFEGVRGLQDGTTTLSEVTHERGSAFSGPKTFVIRLSKNAPPANCTVGMKWMRGAQDRVQHKHEIRNASWGKGWDGRAIPGDKIVGRRTQGRMLGMMMEKGGRFGVQGKFIVRAAKRKMGELVTMLCFEGGLTASFSEQMAMQRWWPTVANMPLGWAYVGLDDCGICKTDAEALERVQLQVGRSILAAPHRVPNAVILGELGWTTVQLRMMHDVLIEWGRIIEVGAAWFEKIGAKKAPSEMSAGER
jgi:hypothetical protein